MGHNPRVPFRKPLAAALLLLAVAAMPLWLWLGAHALEHGHAETAAGHGTEWAGLAKALVHGHHHPEESPDHEHHLLPSPPLRPDPPQDLQAPSMAFQPAPDPGHVLLSSANPWRGEIRLSGSSPPRLHLLCVLLI
jgi:hypothetical protein